MLFLCVVSALQWFQELLNRYEFSNKFTPNQLRHIFVDERCAADHVPGPANQGAARIMGNSVGECRCVHICMLRAGASRLCEFML